jgi:decaprenyl-phosphate phosphoribosyltransferase
MQLHQDAPLTVALPQEKSRPVTSDSPAAGAKAATSVVGLLKVYFAIARPDHWFKNVFMALGVVLAYFCHPEVFGPSAFLSILWAVATTCLIASSNYVLNEILDAPTDRSHPVKRFRPIPSGKVRVGIAIAEWIGLGIIGLAMAAAINGPFFLFSLTLLFMGVIYNTPPVRCKDLPYVDVLSESVNNPLRLLLGWFAVTPHEFPPVSLLIAYWMIGAFFMAAKRFSEYRSIGNPQIAAAYRASFRYYDDQKLLISMFFYTTCFALFLGVFIIRYHLELILIVPLIGGFVSYYLSIAFKTESPVQNPEKLYSEWGLMAYLTVCVAAFVGLMFVSIPVLYEWFNVVPAAAPPLWQF